MFLRLKHRPRSSWDARVARDVARRAMLGAVRHARSTVTRMPLRALPRRLARLQSQRFWSSLYMGVQKGCHMMQRLKAYLYTLRTRKAFDAAADTMDDMAPIKALRVRRLRPSPLRGMCCSSRLYVKYLLNLTHNKIRKYVASVKLYFCPSVRVSSRILYVKNSISVKMTPRIRKHMEVE